MKPKIILYTDGAALAGTERHMLDLAAGLADLGASARIACPAPSVLQDHAKILGIQALTVQKRGKVDFRAIEQLADLLRRGEADILHAHNGRTHLAAAAAVARAGRGCCVATQHFLQPNRTGRRGAAGWLARQAHRWIGSHTAGYIAISEAVRQAMLNRQDARPEHITVIPNGITAPEPLSNQHRLALRETLAVRADAPLIVCVARLEKEKSVATLIDAMPHVLAQHPTARLVVAGEGDEHPALQAKINTLNLGRAVSLLGFRNDATMLMAAGELFVLPSLAEPFGLVVLEAMALARPVIATRAGGPVEIVEESRTGLLITPGSAGEMSTAICQLLSDPRMREPMGLAGRARFERLFTARRMAQQTLAFYQAAMGAKSSAAEAAIPSSENAVDRAA